MEKDKIDKIVFKVILSLLGCKWFYDFTIKDAIEHELHQSNKSVSEEIKDQIYSEVKEGLEKINKEYRVFK